MIVMPVMLLNPPASNPRTTSSARWNVSKRSAISEVTVSRLFLFIGVAYSERSACSTSTREARAAGISDAITAAAISTAAAPVTASSAGHLDAAEESRREARQRIAADRAGGDADHGDLHALRQHARQQLSRRRSDRETHAELARPRAHREREHAGDADDGDQQRDAGESGEHERVQPLGRQHLRAHVLERGGALDRLVGGQLADRRA